MKNSRYLMPFLCAAFALAPLASSAVTKDTKATPPPSGERAARSPRNRPRANSAPVSLTQEESEKLRLALRKVREDKSVIDAQKSVADAQKKLNEARKAAVLKADPSLEEVVKKFGDRPLMPGARQPGVRPDGSAREGGRRSAAKPTAPVPEEGNS
ncbi:MAG: hypothetical protein LBD01_03940 [Puniceicoccales bacterium]|nr:hypothetical protein [Puniceicoccales bacterium]